MNATLTNSSATLALCRRKAIAMPRNTNGMQFYAMSVPMRRQHDASATPAVGQCNVNPQSTLSNAK
eukprot:3897903-Pyramimonas_sp.AAC.1